MLPLRVAVTVPEVAVHEHGNSEPRKDYVWTPREASEVLAKAIAASVKVSPQNSFRQSLFASDARHDSAAGLGAHAVWHVVKGAEWCPEPTELHVCWPLPALNA